MHEGVEALRPAPGAEHEGQVRCALLRTHAEEIDWLANSIAHLVRTGKAPGEIAVLCMQAGDFAEIQGALVARDIPVEVVGLSGLLHLPRSADLVAVCEVLQDPGRTPPWSVCSPAPAGVSARATSPFWGGAPACCVSHARVGANEDRTAGSRRPWRGSTRPRWYRSPTPSTRSWRCPSRPRDDDGLPFSPDARVRFARLAAELRDLRRSLADPLMEHPAPGARRHRPRGRALRVPARAGRPPPRDPVELPRRRSSPRATARPRCWPSSATCAPPPSTRRASTTPCPAARTPSSAGRTSPRAGVG